MNITFGDIFNENPEDDVKIFDFSQEVHLNMKSMMFMLTGQAQNFQSGQTE